MPKPRVIYNMPLAPFCLSLPPEKNQKYQEENNQRTVNKKKERHNDNASPQEFKKDKNPLKARLGRCILHVCASSQPPVVLCFLVFLSMPSFRAYFGKEDKIILAQIKSGTKKKGQNNDGRFKPPPNFLPRSQLIILSSVAVFFFFFALLQSVGAFSLHLVCEIKVALVKVVDADVAVLSAAGVAAAGGVGSDGVEGTKVATDAADLVLEDLVVEAGFEFTLAGRGGGDVHGGLATAEDDKVLLAGDGGAVEGGIGGVGLEDLEVASRDELSR